MKFFNTIGVLFLILILVFQMTPINNFDYKGIEEQKNQSLIEQNEEVDTKPATRSTEARQKYSSIIDNFDDNSKVSFSNNVVVGSGEVKLEKSGWGYKTSGSLISSEITPPGTIKWNKFYSSISEEKLKRYIEIDNTKNPRNLTDFPVKVTMDTKSLIDAGKMKADCGDLRFYDDNGTDLNYYIESGINTVSTIIWVNVTFVAASSITYIYVSYGNPALEGKSDIDTVVIFQDNFSAGFSKWKVQCKQTGSFGVGNEVLYMNTSSGTETGGLFLQPNKWYDGTDEYIMYFDFMLTQDADTTSANVLYGHDYWTRCYNSRLETYPGTTNILNQWYNWRVYLNTTHVVLERKLPTDTTWQLRGSGERIPAKESTVSTFTTHVGHSFWRVIRTQWDNVLIRKFADPEPTTAVSPEPGAGLSDITFKVLDADDGSELMTVTNEEDISSINAQSIKLKAEFSSDGWGTKILKDWSVEWNTIPIIDDVSCPASVNRTQSALIKINATDIEEPEYDLIVETFYKGPTYPSWRKDFVSTPVYVSDHWEVRFEPPKTAHTGLYQLRFTCKDSLEAETEFTEQMSILVINNKPTHTGLFLSPSQPITTNTLSASLEGASDIETSKSNLEIWYHWYKDGIFVEDCDNLSSIDSTKTFRGENWKCVAYAYDGEDLSELDEGNVTILNSPPELSSSFFSYEMLEDSVITLENKLMEMFTDLDNDQLLFSAVDQNYIDINITQDTGTIRLKPPPNWAGIEIVTFYANDSLAEAEATVEFTVRPVNDLPVMLQVGSQLTSEDYPELEFLVKQDESLKLKMLVEDVDGDIERGKLGFVLNLTERTNFYFDYNESMLIFNPTNSDVGTHYINVSVSDYNETPIRFVTQPIKIYVLNVNDPPSVEIKVPADNQIFKKSDKISFVCAAEDIDLNVPDSVEKLTYRWHITSPYIGELGSGPEVLEKKLRPGQYTIHVEVTDSSNATATDTIYITVKDVKTEDFFMGMSHFQASIILIILIIIIVIVLTIVTNYIQRKKLKEIMTKVASTKSEQQMAAGTPGRSQQQSPSIGTQAVTPTVIPPSESKTTAQLPPQAPKLSLQEKLELLEERFLRGDISIDEYKGLKAQYEKEAARAGIHPEALKASAQQSQPQPVPVQQDSSEVIEYTKPVEKM